MQVVLISGKAEAGKTTAANMLKSFLESQGETVVIIPYGQYVKDTAKMIWGWNGKKDEAGRQLLQWWGTDVVRQQDPSFWVDTVIRLARVIQNRVDYLIVDDCRFVNEIQGWYGDVYSNWRPFTIRVERPGHENALTPEQRIHPSEMDLDDYHFDVTLSATNVNELWSEIQNKVLFVKLE